MANIQPYTYQMRTNIKEHNDIINKTNEIIDVLNDVEDRVKRIETVEIPAIKSRLTNIEDVEIPAIKYRLTQIETVEIPALKDRVSTLESKVNTIETVEIPNLKSRVTTLETKVDTLENVTVPALSTRVDVIEFTTIPDIQSKATVLKGRVDTIENTTIPALDGRVTTVEGKVSTLENTTIPALDSRVTTVEGDIGHIEDDVGDLRVDVDNNKNLIDDLNLTVAGKQDYLSAGTGISIVNNVISATASGAMEIHTFETCAELRTAIQTNMNKPIIAQCNYYGRTISTYLSGYKLHFASFDDSLVQVGDFVCRELYVSIPNTNATDIICRTKETQISYSSGAITITGNSVTLPVSQFELWY